MKKRRILKNIRLSDLSFDDILDDVSSDLDLKIERLHSRRWRELRRKERMA
jgi:hypothetical protein